MNIRAFILAGLVSASGLFSPAQAAVVDPAIGGSYDFGWTDGLGQIDYIIGDVGTEWTLTLATAGRWVFSVQDLFVPGDEFALNLFGVEVPWGNTSTTPDGYFSGSVSRYLAAGTYTATLFLNALAPGFESGEARASILPSAVPLPASLPLLLAGLGGLGFMRRRRMA